MEEGKKKVQTPSMEITIRRRQMKGNTKNVCRTFACGTRATDLHANDLASIVTLFLFHFDDHKCNLNIVRGVH